MWCRRLHWRQLPSTAHRSDLLLTLAAEHYDPVRGTCPVVSALSDTENFLFGERLQIRAAQNRRNTRYWYLVILPSTTERISSLLIAFLNSIGMKRFGCPTRFSVNICAISSDHKYLSGLPASAPVTQAVLTCSSD